MSSSCSLKHNCMVGVLDSSKRVLHNKLEQDMSYSGFCRLLQHGRMPFRAAKSDSDKCDYCIQWGMVEEPLVRKLVDQCKEKVNVLDGSFFQDLAWAPKHLEPSDLLKAWIVAGPQRGPFEPYGAPWPRILSYFSTKPCPSFMPL